ncbi:hypothetical protein GLOIN_2v1665440 [Rhizophagus irregularis DAOM 181602=DAOM 197198]|uniref:Uncharacterized protein n=1 Tax=Rhizophagus irregularis (strain DAOM 181602 / DAOM 197198 / MUCL 43194) TaxID=747089 RepID=A0A2P4PJH2_RHIID|nr:hypothetical protein GLOIN_2v1665440 [Rhizophagus irregularis DAOM 181602=DAOM 197198]POG65549.1 hypothetical protein GLOIN_2v1665440 [Rhizophagus irregularis DAOM 181602=DAOM 197198]RGB31405.1 hypothetical protein C1646_709163 [Rhizophagus diaphanus] [Rhizophagus sp. MUCL 43196]|eukprot:XP_025172415.1 hypothetical protein GLOIN_2v1665440 [Rhizophagus irregularis DAOM 181602=DAOM 197198]
MTPFLYVLICNLSSLYFLYHKFLFNLNFLTLKTLLYFFLLILICNFILIFS